MVKHHGQESLTIYTIYTTITAEEENEIKKQETWEKTEILELFNEMLPDFSHKETGKYLDARM